MKVMWFTPSFSKKGDGYNGSGWISSLEEELKGRDGIELFISFPGNINDTPIKFGNITYIPLSVPKENFLVKLKNRIFLNHIDEEVSLWPIYREVYLRVIDKYKPDVIQVFGSENKFGLIGGHTNIPVVLHLQGLMNPCLNAYLPPFVSWRDYSCLFSIFDARRRQKQNWERYCCCEREVLKNIKNFIGRTHWDRSIINIYSSEAKYYYCSEILRDEFYSKEERDLPEKLTITSVISSPLYKGLDLILKTAKLLKECGLNFDWNVYGNLDSRIPEKVTGINHYDVNVNYKGVASATQLKDALLHSTLYFHSSYIDNSPNSVCEAQILGCSVICTNVGGTSSIVEDNKTGFLIPANDPHKATDLILQLYNDPDMNIRIGRDSRIIASRRHNKDIIVNDLLNIYLELTSHK